MEEVIQKSKEFIRKPLFLKIAVGAGLIIMVLIALSDGKPEKSESPPVNPDVNFISAEIYSAQIEERLADILTSIKGVGKAEVFLTLESSEEYVFAETVRTTSGGTDVSFVILDKGISKEALVRKVNNPAITGIIIVCEGGDNARTVEKIYKAVSTSLGIPTTRIFVAEMK